ncbi:MAG: transposase, partial [Candidatus Nitrosopolaris sp.]
GKKGAGYDYPDSFVQLLGYVKAYFHLPYRQTEGVVRAHAAKNAANREIKPTQSSLSEKIL